MNYYYNNDYIGATGVYGITEYVDTTVSIASNILNYKIDYTSNILNTKIDYTSNVLIDYTNELKNELWSVNPNNNNSYLKINLDEFGNSNLYLNNPNGFGKINFLTNHPLFPNANNILTRIDYDNKLYVYFAGSLLPPKLPAWWCVEEQLSAIFDVNTAQDIAIIGLQGELIELQANLGYLSGEIQQLQIYTLLDTANTRIALAINSFALAQNVLLGASGISLALATAALATASYINNNYISLNLYNEITSNNTISSVERSNLLNIVTSNIYTNSLKISTNSSNLNLINGFINCNISTQQYISNLNTNYIKTDYLDANFGTIGNINNIQTNEIIVSGVIKQNNILLDDTYLTSNHLYNLSYNYTAGRQYPSKLFSSVSSEKTVTFLGKQVYNETLFLDTNVSYGNGAYELYSSSTFDNGITNKSKLFNYDISETANTARWGINLYNSATGLYQGNNSIDNVYYGEFIIIKFPQEILLTKFRIYQNTNFTGRSPSLWKVFGSDDGINFNEIPQAHQFTRLTQSNFVSNYYEKVLSAGHTKLYSYIGFVFSALVSTAGQTTLDFAELKIYGKEIIGTNILNTIYASSNDVINIAQNQPTYFKKLNIIIPNTRFSYDGPNALYYYDLNIQQYIPYSTYGTSYGTFKYRNFRISTFVENTDWIGGRNLKDSFGNYFNNPETLTLYCNNAENINGIVNPNDSYHNCIILGKSINTNIGNWSAVNNNFNYIRYLSRIGWDIQIVLEQLN